MSRALPEKLLYFLKNGIKDVDDGYEYSSELNRVLNSDECQTALTSKEVEALRNFSDDVKKVGEINYYSEQKIKDLENDHFGSGGILGFLGAAQAPAKPVWPF